MKQFRSHLAVMAALTKAANQAVVVVQMGDQSTHLTPDAAEALGAAIIGAATTARLLADLERCKHLPGIDPATVDTLTDAIGNGQRSPDSVLAKAV